VWDEAALAPVTEALLLRYLVLAQGLSPAAAHERLAPALVAHASTWAALWRARSFRHDNAGDAAALAQALRQPLADTLRLALQSRGR
jgi:hypothetical protein